MRDRQLCAVTLAAASVPALLYLPRLGWVWATAAAAISALLLGLCGRRCAPGGLTEVIPAAFGRAGRAVLALVLLGGALLLGGGYDFRVGQLAYVRGPGYMGSGPVTEIERGAEQ
mgnify:CR=1 FL=1